ncbi:MAG: membrane protein insertase YidC [Candidatus Omnitrophica bacterium]|nr:membrane protein insertase YidC [Candidatus Omnitrophota bacterium]
MEKRFIVALGLCFLVIVFYPHILNHFFPQKASITHVVTPQGAPQVPPEAGAAQRKAEEKIEEAAPAFKEEFYELATGKLKAVFSNVDGSVIKLTSIESNVESAPSGRIVDAENSSKGSFVIRFTEPLCTQPIHFKVVNKTSDSIELEGEILSGLILRKKFSLLSGRHAIELEASFTNKTSGPLKLSYSFISRFFAGEAHYGNPTIEAAYFNGDKVSKKNGNAMRKEPYINKTALKWIGLEEKYFTMVIKPEREILSANTSFVGSKDLVNRILIEDTDIKPGETISARYLIYCGPKRYDELKSFGFEKLMYTKVLGNLWVYILQVLFFFHRILKNYGLAIIALSVLMKILFAPLTHISFKSMRKMQELQPKIKALQEELKKDPQRMNKEIMELYRKHKVNPMGGCLPMLLQMPIFIALYQALSQAIELKGAPFIWWIKDLSEPDKIYTLPFSIPFIGNSVNVLPLLMIVSMVWQQKLTPTVSTSKEQQTMMLIMPVVFGIVFYNLPSGLVLYWFVNNMLTIGHQLLFKRNTTALATA